MTPLNFKESNITLRAADGDEEKVNSIQALVSFLDIETGVHYPAVLHEQQWLLGCDKPEGVELCLCFRTVWKPSKRDITTIATGGPIVIQTLGKYFPPILPTAIAPGYFTEPEQDDEETNTGA